MVMESEAHQKVTTAHLSRLAYLYVRQSTLRQVFENTESTHRQYALRERAVALGWPLDRIVVIDSDLVHSSPGEIISFASRFRDNDGKDRRELEGKLASLRESDRRQGKEWQRIMDAIQVGDIPHLLSFLEKNPSRTTRDALRVQAGAALFEQLVVRGALPQPDELIDADRAEAIDIGGVLHPDADREQRRARRRSE